jgi:hypothetical protein
MTHEALTILRMIGVDPGQALEAVALAERLVVSCETLDRAAETLG